MTELIVIDKTCLFEERCAKKGTYRASAKCYNCYWVGEMRFTLGHEIEGEGECPQCECRKVKGISFITRDDEQEIG